AQARLLLAVDEVARDTAQAWVEVRRHEDLQAIAREQKLGVTAIADLVRTRRRQGASPRSDEMQAQAREEAARAFELESAAQLERWRAQLRHLTGLDAVPATGGDVPAAMAQARVGPAGSQPAPAAPAAPPPPTPAPRAGRPCRWTAASAAASTPTRAWATRTMRR